jgi:hypothetical protein
LLYSRRKDPIMQKISAIADLRPDQMTRVQLLCAWTPQMIQDRTAGPPRRYVALPMRTWSCNSYEAAATEWGPTQKPT